MAVALVATAAQRDVVDRSFREALIVAVPVAAGLYAMRSPRDRRFGWMLVASGLIWSLTALAESAASLPYSLGRVSAWLIFPVLMYLVLAYPEGRIASAADRRVYLGIALLIGVLYVGSAPFVEAYPAQTPWATCDALCPPNAFLVLRDEPAAMHAVVEPVRELLAIVLMLLVSASLVRRLRAADPLSRRQVLPVLVAGLLSGLMLAAYVAARRVAPGPAAVSMLGQAWSLSVPALAAAFCAGLLRRRLTIARVLEQGTETLAAGGGLGRLRGSLARALHDPGAEILVPGDAPGEWRDTSGRARFSADEARQGRRLTPVGDRASPAAALLHSGGLDEELCAAVEAPVLAAVRQQRLERRFDESLRRVTASRERIARAAALERSRIERDLHDGAQQRLIALRIRLSLAAELLETDPEGGAAAMRGLGDEVDLTLDELRALAQGAYPPLLKDRGLADALSGVAAGSPLPVHLETSGLTRLPPEIESAVYFTCVEALQNATKHARGATGLWLTLRLRDGSLSLDVRDDGAGFAPEARHQRGLRNMVDRIEAAGGRLAVVSALGHGTRITGSVPCGRSSCAPSALSRR